MPLVVDFELEDGLRPASNMVVPDPHILLIVKCKITGQVLHQISTSCPPESTVSARLYHRLSIVSCARISILSAKDIKSTSTPSLPSSAANFFFLQHWQFFQTVIGTRRIVLLLIAVCCGDIQIQPAIAGSLQRPLQRFVFIIFGNS